MFTDFIIVFFIFVFLFILILYTYFLSVYIIDKIFKLNLLTNEKWKFVLYLIFFPISIIFIKYPYKIIKYKGKIKSFWHFFGIFILIFLLSILISGITKNIIKDNFFKLFIVNGQSMYPTYYNKDFVVSNNIGKINRNDVIIHKVELEDISFIQRVIGLPGETVKIEDGNVYIKKVGSTTFEKLDETFLNKENYGKTFVENSTDKREYILGKGQYFVLGDNRQHSSDSRSCMSYTCLEDNSTFYVEKENIIGKIYLDLGYFNLKTFSFTHPNIEENGKKINTSPKFFNIK